MNKTFFIADTHFMHEKILTAETDLIPHGRPFATIEEHDETIVRNWNSVVGDKDTVYQLGDFALGKGNKKILKCYYQMILHRLNGRKHLIVGNHDTKEIKELEGWESVTDLSTIKVRWTESKLEPLLGPIQNNHVQKIVLCHYPLAAWGGSHYDGMSWHLHGHMHNTYERSPNRYYLDVGVDCWDFKPVEFEQIKEAFKDIKFKKLSQLQEDRNE